MFKLVLEKAEEPEIKLPTSAGSSKKQESSRKTSTSALLTMPKTLTMPKNFPQFPMVHIVKGLGIVNKAEVDTFLELSCFFDDPVDVGSLVSGWASLVAQRIKHLPAMWETWVRSLGWEDSLEKEMATHSSVLAWRIPGTGEPGGLPSLGSHRVGHD